MNTRHLAAGIVGAAGLALILVWAAGFERSGAVEEPKPVASQVTAPTQHEPSAESRVQFRGRVVTPDGSPIKSFRMMFTNSFGAQTEVMEFETGSGEFDLWLPDLGDWTFWVSAEGFKKLYKQEVPPAAPPAKSGLEVVLEYAAKLQVTVVDPDGEPLPDISVGLRPTRPEMGRPRPRKTDNAGIARFEQLNLGELRAVVHAPGIGYAISDVVELTPANRQDELKLILSPGGGLEGTVFQRVGDPRGSVPLHLRRRDRAEGVPLTSSMTKTVSQPGGQFEYSSLPPGTYVLSVGESPWGTRDSRWPRVEHEIEVIDGETTRVDVILFDGTEVTVHGLLTRNGEPFADQTITPRVAGSWSGNSAHSAKSDYKGRFEVILSRSGDWDFNVDRHVDGQYCSAKTRETIPDEPGVELHLDLRMGGLRGRIVDLHGNGVPQCEIMASSYQKDGDRILARCFATTDSDDDGRFELLNLDEGSFELSARGVLLGDVQVRAAEVEDGLIFELQSLEGAKINGVVRDASGAVLVGAKIQISALDYKKVRVTPVDVMSDGAGAFQFTDLPAGEFVLWAARDDLVSDWIVVETSAGGVATRDIELGVGGYIMGRVTGGAGPEEGLSVSAAEPTLGRGAAERCLSGEAKLGPLHPGSFEVHAYFWGVGAHSGRMIKGEKQTVTVEAGEVTEVALTL